MKALLQTVNGLAPAVPILIALLVIVILAVLAGIWFFVRRIQQLNVKSKGLEEKNQELKLREQILLRENEQRHELEKILERGKREWEAIFDSV